MTAAVSDSTVLIYLARMGDLALLRDVLGGVTVPGAVHDEVVTRGRREGYSDALAVEEATGDYLSVEPVSGDAADRAERVRESAGLGRGESAAIALAEARGSRCLTDDHAARRTAEPLGIPVGGTIYVLLEGVDDGEFDLDGYVERLDALTEHGFRMDASLYRRALDAGREVGGNREG